MKKSIIVLVAILLVNTNCKKEHDLTIAFSGIVNFIVGEANIVDKKGILKALGVGDTVPEGSKIITIGKDSIVDIYINENVVRILGDSILEFSKLSSISGKENVDLLVKKGSVFSKVMKKLSKDETYQVRSQTATASVRGTEFMVQQLNNSTKVSCLEGKVVVKDVENKQQEVILTKKEEADVTLGENIVKKQITEDKLKKLEIIANIKTLQEDIKQKYQDQKNEIRQKFEDDREVIKKAVTDQKEKDQKMLEDQKQTDKKNIEETKAKTDDAKKESVEKVTETMDQTKKALEEQKKSIKPDMNVKPEIKKNNQ